MDWLQKLLSSDAPANAALQSAALSFRGLFPWWAAVLASLVIGMVVFFLYSREHAQAGAVRRWLMALARTAAVGLLLLLLLRPVLVAVYVGERPRGVALLIDNSQSMMLRDHRLSAADQLRVAIAKDLVAPDTSVSNPASLTTIPSATPENPARADLVRAVLANPRLDLVNRLKGKGPLRVYLFGQQLRNTARNAWAGQRVPQGEKNLLAAFKADEPRTALADAIHDLLLNKDDDLPSAIVLVTDGRDNASKLPLEEAARECARLQVPLHIYGVGSSEGGILRLLDVGVAETLFYDDTVSVPIRWRIQGFRQQEVVVTLRLGSKVVTRRPATTKEMQQKRAVLTFVPRKSRDQVDKVDLVATIQLKANSAFHDEIRRPVRLIDRRVKVLYVENSPRWEYHFLQAALLRDRRVQASFLLVNGDPGVLQSGVPFLPALPVRDKLFAFDLVILGDVPSSYLGKERMEWLRDFVSEGGGLVLIAGPEHAPASYVDEPLAEVLPVEFLPFIFAGAFDVRPQPFTPVLTDFGKRSDMLALADEEDENLRIWKQLPGFYWNYPVTKLRPGAVALLNHPTLRMGDKPMPILASQYYGKGQVLFLATAETWRWRYNVGNRYFARFWGQVVYQLGLPHLLGNGSHVQLALQHAEVILGRPCAVYARLLDAQFRPLREEHVAARLEHLDDGPGQTTARKIMLEAVPGRPGEYQALLANDVPGRFELTLDNPEPASFMYRVALPPQHELEPIGMAEGALRRAARISGGRFYREEDLHRLPELVVPRQATFTQRQEILLWNPLVLLLFVGLVSTEWVVRKFSNLS